MPIILFIFGFGLFLLYGFNLHYPTHPYFDEHYFVPAARELLNFSSYSETTHPPLGKLLITLSIFLFGDSSFSWRLPSLLFGTFATLSASYIGYQLTGRITTALFIFLILFFDGLWITQARIGMLNAPMMFFILLSIVCWLSFIKTRYKPYLYVFIISAALGFACKWHAGLVLLIPLISSLLGPHNSHRLKTQDLSLLLIIFLLTYLSTFIFIPFIQGYSFQDIFTLQIQIPSHHLNLHGVSYRYESPWYTWPFLIRPIWYGFSRHHPNLPLEQQTIDGIWCIGNPVNFIFFIPILSWLIYRSFKFRSSFHLFLLSCILLFWVPSGFIGRYTMFHHFYPAFSFYAIALGIFYGTLWDKGIFYKIAVTLLLIITFIAYQFFLPLWIGLPISHFYYNMHLWLPSWT